MSVYDEFPSSTYIQTLHPRKSKVVCIPTGAFHMFWGPAGPNMEADWDSLRTPAEVFPVAPPPVAQPVQETRKQLHWFSWSEIFEHGPYDVSKRSSQLQTHTQESYMPVAQAWLDQHKPWLLATYAVADDHFLVGRIANVISDLERDAAAARGVNVG